LNSNSRWLSGCRLTHYIVNTVTSFQQVYRLCNGYSQNNNIEVQKNADGSLTEDKEHFRKVDAANAITKLHAVEQTILFIYLFKLTGYKEQKTASNTLPETKLTKTYMKTVAYR
jgi:hypothetical protein